MCKLPSRLLVLLILAIKSIYGMNEMPSTISTLDSLLAQDIIIITDPDSKFYPDNPTNPTIISIKEFYRKLFPFSNTQLSNFYVDPSSTNLQNSYHGTIPRITLRKKPFLYDRPFNFHRFDHINAINDLPNERFLMLIGPPRSGKTLSLRYLYELERLKKPWLISIFIDLPNLFENFDPLSFNTLSINDILCASVSNELIELVINLLDFRPSSLRLLFDDVDQVPLLARNNILNIIHVLGQKGVRVAISSNSDISENFDKVLPAVLRRIPIKSEIFGENLRKYMTRHWINKLAMQNIQLDKQLVHDYYTAFAIIMQNSPLPRNIAVMQQLADYFSDITAQKPAILDVSVYALKSNIHRPQISEIFQSVEKIYMSKMAFYDKYFQNLKPHEMQYYGIKAVHLLCDKNYFPITEWQNGVNQVKQLITDNAHLPRAYPYVLTVSPNNFEQITQFIHNEYLYYFAAKEILTSIFTTHSPHALAQSFFQVLSHPELRFIAEFIDKCVEDAPVLANAHSPLWTSTVSNDESVSYRILNNLIKNGLDGLCSKVFENIGVHQIEKYLTHAGNQLAPPSLGIMSHRFFGMLPLIAPRHQTDMFRGYVRRSPMFSNANKFHVMLTYNMRKTYIAATELGVMWPIENLIQHAAEQSLTIFNSVLNRYSHFFQNDPGILTRVGYKLLIKFGPKSVDLLRTLKNFGVSYSPLAHDKDKRTLAHIAVEWMDLDLLKFIHSEFSFPATDLPNRWDRTVLFMALGSNPFLKWTPDEFWPMMEYLIQHLDLIDANREAIKRTIFHFDDVTTAPLRKISTPFSYRALIFDDSQFTEEDMSIARARFQCVPFKDWDLPTPLKYGRRNAVIKHAFSHLRPELYPGDYVTVSELIIKYRGLDTLSERSQRAYENAIFRIITNEMKDFNPNQMLRVFANILDSVQTHAELMRMKNMYLNDIHPNVPQAWYSEPYYKKINELFKKREQNEIIQSKSSSNVPKVRTVTTKIVQNPILIDDSESISKVDVDWNHIEMTIEWAQACVDNFLTF